MKMNYTAIFLSLMLITSNSFAWDTFICNATENTYTIRYQSMLPVPYTNPCRSDPGNNGWYHDTIGPKENKHFQFYGDTEGCCIINLTITTSTGQGVDHYQGTDECLNMVMKIFPYAGGAWLTVTREFWNTGTDICNELIGP